MKMTDSNDATLEERVSDLEKELKTTQKQIIRLTEELMGTITILALPLSNVRKLELGFTSIRDLPNKPLKIIIHRFVIESKNSDLNFDEMITPIVSVLGFERAWKLLSREIIKETYGDWALGKWEEMAKSHPCEE